MKLYLKFFNMEIKNGKAWKKIENYHLNGSKSKEIVKDKVPGRSTVSSQLNTLQFKSI